MGQQSGLLEYDSKRRRRDRKTKTKNDALRPNLKICNEGMLVCALVIVHETTRKTHSWDTYGSKPPLPSYHRGT